MSVLLAVQVLDVDASQLHFEDGSSVHALHSVEKSLL